MTVTRSGRTDLTQLVLGIDRGSGTVSHLFDENDRAVLGLTADVIDEARRLKKPIGICGQAPSDFPEFARWLVEQGITSISLNLTRRFAQRWLLATKRRSSQCLSKRSVKTDHTHRQELK